MICTRKRKRLSAFFLFAFLGVIIVLFFIKKQPRKAESVGMACPEGLEPPTNRFNTIRTVVYLGLQDDSSTNGFSPYLLLSYRVKVFS